MLQGVVDLATEATGCHACFIYLLEGDRLTIRAASPVFADAVGNVQMGLDEGLTGWVARHRTPEFIRDRAMADPRMKYIPQLQEERFQSMVAVPILARAGDTIGVIVLHTRGAARVPDDTLKLLVAHRLAGQRRDRERPAVRPAAPPRRHADPACRDWPRRLPRPATPETSARIVTLETRSLLGAEVCQLYRLQDGELRARAAGRRSRDRHPSRRCRPPGCCWRRSTGGPRVPPARSLWPQLDVADLLVVPLTAGGERVGLLCAGAPARRAFSGEDTEMARAIAHLAAIAIKRAELIEGLTNANIVKDLFEALAAGATSFAAAKAAEVRCDLTGPYLLVCAEPAGGREQRLGRVAGIRRGARPRARRTGPRRGDRRRARTGPRAAGAGARVARNPLSSCCASAASSGEARRRRDRHQRAARVGRPTPPAPTARPRTRPRSGGRCSATAGRSPTRRSVPTAIWCTSPPRTRHTTACARPSIG